MGVRIHTETAMKSCVFVLAFAAVVLSAPTVPEDDFVGTAMETDFIQDAVKEGLKQGHEFNNMPGTGDNVLEHPVTPSPPLPKKKHINDKSEGYDNGADECSEAQKSHQCKAHCIKEKSC